MTLSLAAMEKLMKEAGASRVGEDAKAELKEILEKDAKRIANRAVKLAEHANRKTVRAKDIRLAK
ncbi:histone [Candidatus Woesearchaeota archaeon]|nr:histone [Candidatus Woesearchaeota archaeon]